MNVKEKVIELIKIPNDALSLYLLNQDRFKHKLSLETKKDIIVQSINEGTIQAQLLRQKYPKYQVKDLIEALDIKLVYLNETNPEDYIMLAHYFDNTITLYQENINKLTLFIKELDIDILNHINITDIILAHELYHYLEDQNQDLYTNNVKVKLFKYFKKTVSISSACEIGAMAFAQSLLDLSFSPIIFSYPTIYIFNPLNSEPLYQTMLKYSQFKM